MSENSIKLSVVVPCYNEEGNVEAVYAEAVRILDTRGISMEMIFVNDGSTDDTMRKLEGIVEQAQVPVRVIDFSRNFGKEAAMMAGLADARGEYTVIMDGDMQQSPEVVLEMYQILESEPDVDCVAAVQRRRKEGALLSFFKRAFYYIINKASSVDFVSGASDFRMMRRPVVEAVLSVSEYFRFSKGIFSFVGFNTRYLPYEVRERAAGKTKWSFRKLFAYAVDGIIGFTTAPLRFLTVSGTLLSLASFVYLAVVVVKRIFFGDPVQGFATTVGCILLIGGLQLLGMGIMGEYLGRTYIEAKRRPVYIKRKTLDSREKQARNSSDAPENGLIAGFSRFFSKNPKKD